VVETAFVRAGSETETDKPGVRWVTAQAAYLSHRDLPQAKLDHVSSSVGGGLRLFVEADHFRYEVMTTAPWVPNATFLLHGALRNADLTEENVTEAKKAVASALRGTEAPLAKALRIVAGRFYDDPIRFHRLTAEQIDAITLADCRAYYKHYFTPGRVTISIAGQIEASSLGKTLANTLASWPPGQEGVAPLQKTLTESFTMVRTLPVASAYLCEGCLGPPPASTDFPAFAVFGSYLGRGRAAHLTQTFRETGHAYQVGTTLLPASTGTLLLGFAQFEPARFDPVQNRIEFVLGETMDLMRGAFSSALAGPTDEELQRAKRTLIVDYMLSDPPLRGQTTAFVSGHQRVRDRAFWLGWWEMVGAGFETDAKFPDLVQGVTKEAIVEVAKKYGSLTGMLLLIPEWP